MEDKKEVITLKDAIRAEMLKHIETAMNDLPTWEAVFKLDNWDYEDLDVQIKLNSLLGALYDILLSTQPNEVEIRIKYAVYIEDRQADDGKQVDYFG